MSIAQRGQSTRWSDASLQLSPNDENQIHLSRNIIHVANLFHICKRGNEIEFISRTHHEGLIFINNLPRNFVPHRNVGIVSVLIAMLPVAAHAKRPGRCSLFVPDDSELQWGKQCTSMQIRVNRNIFCHVVHFRGIVNIITVGWRKMSHPIVKPSLTHKIEIRSDAIHARQVCHRVIAIQIARLQNSQT